MIFKVFNCIYLPIPGAMFILFMREREGREERREGREERRERGERERDRVAFP